MSDTLLLSAYYKNDFHPHEVVGHDTTHHFKWVKLYAFFIGLNVNICQIFFLELDEVDMLK